MTGFRVGFGTDVHRLAAGRPLIIGGVGIPSELGSEGHSDADVLIHAVTDALLGALALGDIGTHFPSSEERWRNAESSIFLKYAAGLIRQRGYQVGNVDAVVDLETPKLSDHIDEMRTNLAVTLDIGVECVSVKAKTGERVDAVGEARAVTAKAVVLLTPA
jgi:2-C-methyl-D-erythritol 2,4-cyclodiphosphate synthase